MYSDLISAIEQSDLPGARESLKVLLGSDQIEPCSIHEALYSVVHQVVNPPFINPHLAKMYAVNRQFIPYLEPEDIVALLRVEVEEYTRRDKLPYLKKPISVQSTTDFTDIEEHIVKNDLVNTAQTMAAFVKGAGPEQFAKRLLLLGSGFLDRSLGHSFSCTAFILLEMVRRKDTDPWPAIQLLADYFCKGSFQKTPILQYSALSDYKETYLTEAKRAVSGFGVVALHHTITLYAIEQSRVFFEAPEYDHLLTMWAHMLAGKQQKLRQLDEFTTEVLPDYLEFIAVFSKHESLTVVSMAQGALNTKEGRNRLGKYLIKGVLQCYNGQYDPHYLTGLGANLWLIENYHDHPTIVMNALNQYLNYFFSGIR